MFCARRRIRRTACAPAHQSDASCGSRRSCSVATCCQQPARVFRNAPAYMWRRTRRGAGGDAHGERSGATTFSRASFSYHHALCRRSSAAQRGAVCVLSFHAPRRAAAPSCAYGQNNSANASRRRAGIAWCVNKRSIFSRHRLAQRVSWDGGRQWPAVRWLRQNVDIRQRGVTVAKSINAEMTGMFRDAYAGAAARVVIAPTYLFFTHYPPQRGTFRRIAEKQTTAA